MTPIVHPGRPQVAVACGCVLGETPLWDGRTGSLLWVDIRAGTLWRWRPGGGKEPVARALGEPVGFVQPTPEPEVVLVGLKSGIARLDLRDEGQPVPVLRPEPDRPGNRPNDAAVTPDGALLFGTMDDAEEVPTGRFYRWSPAGLETFGDPAVVTNGPALDPERGVVYCADTQGGRVVRHPLRPDGGLGPAEAFVAFRPGDGQPDGLTVDAEGHLWVCHWGGARITRFDPDGVPVLIVPMPTALVTKVAFGGPDLATIFVTTAAIGRDRETDLQAGHLFTFEAGIRGHPAIPCGMGTGDAAP